MAAEVHAIVLDMGSGITKAGFAGDDAPRVVFPTVTGKYKLPNVLSYSMGQQDRVMIGDEAIANRGILNLCWPIENNIIENFGLIERIYHHTIYNELRISPEEHPFLITESPLNPKRNREQQSQLLFEKFNVPAMYIALQPSLSLYASGRHCGCVVDIGDGVISVIPIEGVFVMPRSVKRINFGGRNLTEELGRILINKEQIPNRNTSDLDVVRDIKEKLCYVALDYNQELMKSETNVMKKAYELPDGQTIALQEELFRVPECLFDPSLFGFEFPGIHELIYSSIMLSSLDYRKDFFGNIILSGGTSLFNGLDERLQKEIAFLAPETMRTKIVAPQERKYSVWIGGSILASLSTFQSMWFSKQEYDEKGPSLIHHYSQNTF